MSRDDLARTEALFSPGKLYDEWAACRRLKAEPQELSHARLQEQLGELCAISASVRLAEVGRSCQGRVISSLTLGRGERTVLLWSQMHGDEPTATAALLDLANFLLVHALAAEVQDLLESLTLVLVPMLNPDGAELYTRRNAQGIDINRDALRLVTPEGRALRRLQQELRPQVGFNLHDQSRRMAAGNSGSPVRIALLSVAGDPELKEDEGRKRTMRLCSAIASALTPFAAGHIARYHEDWNPRAFGDNLTAWGTPVVLLESGAPPQGRLSDLARLNFVGLLVALSELARNDLADHDEDDYRKLPSNSKGCRSDVLIEGAHVLQMGLEPQTSGYLADVAFDVERPDREVVAPRTSVEDYVTGAVARFGPSRSVIVEVGDGRFLSSLDVIDARDQLMVPTWSLQIADWPLPSWLNREALEQAAILGVGEVWLVVEPGDLGAAVAWSAQIERSTKAIPKLEVTVDPVGLLDWHAPPQQPGGTFGEAIGRLADISVDKLTPTMVWPSALGLLAPPIRCGQPASFLLLRPQEVSGPTSLEISLGSRLVRVFRDGTPL